VEYLEMTTHPPLSAQETRALPDRKFASGLGLPYEPLGASLPAHQSAHWGAIEALYYASWCAREAGELEDREGASDRLWLA
jgi:hypothetical protein